MQSFQHTLQTCKRSFFNSFFNLDDFTFNYDIGTVPVNIYLPSTRTTRKRSEIWSKLIKIPKGRH